MYNSTYQPYRFGIGISDTAAADCAPVQTLPSGKLHRSGQALVASWDDRVDTQTLVPVASGSSRGETFVLYRSGQEFIPYEVNTATFKPALPVGTRASGTPTVWLADDGSCHFLFGAADLIWRTAEGEWRSAPGDTTGMTLVLDRKSPGRPHMAGWRLVGNSSVLLYGWYGDGQWHLDPIYTPTAGAQIKSAYTCHLAGNKVAVSFNTEHNGTNQAWLMVSDVLAESTGFLVH